MVQDRINVFASISSVFAKDAKQLEVIYFHGNKRPWRRNRGNDAST